VLGGGAGGDNQILSIIKRAKQSVKEIIGNLINLIFGTLGEGVNGISDSFGGIGDALGGLFGGGNNRGSRLSSESSQGGRPFSGF
jgi:phage-related protein